MSELNDLEQLIAGAGDVVQPSRDLRPRVLDAVNEQESEKSAQKHLSRYCLAIGALMLVAAPLTRLLSELPLPKSPSAESIQQSVNLYADQKGMNHDWSAVDVFSRLRQAQADPNRTSLHNLSR